MEPLFTHIKIQVSESLYAKDPESTDLGKRLVKAGIELIAELGFDAFTFKKLGQKVGSPESSVYRYFENKHQFLLYLINWYWSWLEYRILFATTNVEDARSRLENAIEVVTATKTEDQSFEHINEVLLQQIVIAESSKAFLTKDVDRENQLGYFAAYKRLVQRMVDLVKAVDGEFSHPNSLASTIIEGAHVQSYFSLHLPSLTDCSKGEQAVTQFFTQMAFKLLR